MGIENILENLGYRFSGTGKYKRCKKHDSLVINTENDLFYWNSRGIGGNAYQFLTLIENLEKKEALSLTGSLPQIKKKKPTLTLPSKTKIEYLTKRAEFYYQTLLKDKSKIEYWINEGINMSSIHLFKLGWAYECPIIPDLDSFTIPYIKDKDIINIRHRLNSNGADKYRPEMSGLSNYLFNVDSLYRKDGINWPGDAVLLEGEKKAIVFHQHGFRAVSLPGANTWNDSLIKEFHKANVNLIYVALDPGMEEVAEKLSFRIKKLGKNSKPIYLPEKPDDMIKSGVRPKDILMEMN